MSRFSRQRLLLAAALIITVAVILMIFVFQQTRDGRDDNGKPVISATTSSSDWGIIPINQLAESDIVIVNQGSEVLTIKRITTSCSCTSATFVADDTDLPLDLEPGEQVIMNVTFDPQFHDDQPLGEVVREVYITSNDPEREEVTVRFEGAIVKAI